MRKHPAITGHLILTFIAQNDNIPVVFRLTKFAGPSFHTG